MSEARLRSRNDSAADRRRSGHGISGALVWRGGEIVRQNRDKHTKERERENRHTDGEEEIQRGTQTL